MDKTDLLAYAYAYLSYLFGRSYLFGSRYPAIEHIFLFGSVARGDFDEDSDVDIFIDVEPKNEKVVTRIAERALGRFEEIEKEKWRLKGLRNRISLKVGTLEEWKLKEPIEKEGIVLYSTAAGSKLRKYLLFTLEPIKPIKKRIKVIRKLFGRKEQGYADQGLVQRYSGKTLNPRSFIVSSDGLKEVSSFLTKQKIKFSFEEIWK
ncbi:MAG: nucleotidyltransferase domain-containing protein [Nanoarchaeota archaeon]